MDGYCNQVLAATPATESTRTVITRDGRLKLHPKYWPIVQLTGLAYGVQPNGLTQIQDLSPAWIEPESIDFMLDGANAADVSNLIGAGNPNAAALPHVRSEIAAEPAIFPPARDLQRREMLRYFDPRMRRALARMWTEIKVR